MPEFYKNLSPQQWEICIDGIINRPKNVVGALMKYKYDSREINNAIVAGTKSEKIKRYIEQIEKFLDTQILKHDIQAYRGDKSYWAFDTIKLDNNKTLKNLIENFTKGIESGKYSPKEIDEFIDTHLVEKYVKQERFLSTAIEPKAGGRYARKVFWHLTVPKGTKGSMIESYNVERASEAELLLQKGSRLIIDNAKYNKEKHLWELWATIRQ